MEETLLLPMEMDTTQDTFSEPSEVSTIAHRLHAAPRVLAD